MQRNDIEEIKAIHIYYASILDGCLKSLVGKNQSFAILRLVFESILFCYKAKLSGI